MILLLGSGRLMASEDNPWRMDDPDQGVPFNYTLNNRGDFESSKRAWGAFPSTTQENRNSGSGSGETIVPKTRSGSALSKGTGSASQGRTWQVAPGKTARDEIFGYAGPQPKKAGKSQAAPRFGAFPPANGHLEGAPSFRMIKPSQGGIQFGGKFYGAFPPLDDRASQRQRQQRVFRQKKNSLRKLPDVAFPNILPPPVPAPVPEYGPLSPYPRAALPFEMPSATGSSVGRTYQDPGLFGYGFPRP